MAKSLSKIMDQIEKLQKEAAAIQSTVITRMKKEIAAHGLTAAHLFESGPITAGNSPKSEPKTASTAKPKKQNADKPAKYADDQGNTWHGVGKRPQWIHDALTAGRSLDEFLLGAKKAAPAAKKSRATVKTAAVKPKKVIASKKQAPAKKATKSVVAVKPAARNTAKKTAKVAPAKKVAVKKPAVKKIAKPSPTAAADTSQAGA